MPLRELVCSWCGSIFLICPSCYHGQRYCAAPCRDRGRNRSTVAARLRHSKSLEARRDHRDRNRVFRACKKARVMDQGSVSEPAVAQVVESSGEVRPDEITPDESLHLGAAAERGIVAPRLVEVNLGEAIRARRPPSQRCCAVCGRQSAFVWPVGSWEGRRLGASHARSRRPRRREVLRC